MVATTATLQDPIGSFFNQAQEGLITHRKTAIALRKLMLSSSDRAHAKAFTSAYFTHLVTLLAVKKHDAYVVSFNSCSLRLQCWIYLMKLAVFIFLNSSVTKKYINLHD